MRAYEVSFKNDADWVSDGKIEERLLIIAESAPNAMMFAEDYLTDLKVRLKDRRHPWVDSLRIVSVTEMFAVVSGNMGTNILDRDLWISDLAAKALKRIQS